MITAGYQRSEINMMMRAMRDLLEDQENTQSKRNSRETDHETETRVNLQAGANVKVIEMIGPPLVTMTLEKEVKYTVMTSITLKEIGGIRMIIVSIIPNKLLMLLKTGVKMFQLIFPM